MLRNFLFVSKRKAQLNLYTFLWLGANVEPPHGDSVLYQHAPLSLSLFHAQLRQLYGRLDGHYRKKWSVFAVNNNLIRRLRVDILFKTTTSYAANYVQIGPLSGRQKKTKEEAPAARAHFIYASFVLCVPPARGLGVRQYV